MIPGQPINTRGLGPNEQPVAPTPSRPAAPNAIGTQDSPVLEGQKPGIVKARVPAQPRKRRLLPWWEQDWQQVARSTDTRRNRQEVLAEDTGKLPPPVPAEADYLDVIDPDNTQIGLQGPQLRTSLTDREGRPQLRTYIVLANDQFPEVRLTGVPQVVTPVVDREAVPVGFDNFGPVVAYTDVRTLYK
jgi:hypothetical protein